MEKDESLRSKTPSQLMAPLRASVSVDMMERTEEMEEKRKG